MKEPLTVLHEITPRHGGGGRAGPPMWHLPQQFRPWPHHHAPSAASWVAFIFAGNLDHGFPERVWALGKPAGPPARSLGPQERGAGRRLQAEPAGMHQGQGPADAHGFFHRAGRQHRQPPGSKDPTLPDSRTDSANTLVQTHLQRAPSCLNRPPTPQAPGSVLCRSPLSSRLFFATSGYGDLALCPPAVWKRWPPSCHRGGATAGPPCSVTSGENASRAGRPGLATGRVFIYNFFCFQL